MGNWRKYALKKDSKEHAIPANCDLPFRNVCLVLPDFLTFQKLKIQIFNIKNITIF